MSGCRISDELKIAGIPSVALENSHIRVVVLAGKGSDIYEFRHKPSGIDLLWKTPWGVTNPQTYVQDTPGTSPAFLDLYPGGWQELFPNAGGSCTYKGAALGFHGEVCKVPWEYRITERSSKRVSVKFSVRTVRTPFLLEKTLALEKDSPTLILEETVSNQGAEPMDFMWGHHPAFGAPFLSEHCRLFVPAKSVEVSHAIPGQILTPEARFESFPVVKTADGRDFDLSRMRPPCESIASLTYLTITDGWYCLVNEQTRLGFALRWDVEVFRYVWLWEEFCGTRQYPWWGRGYVVGIEPQSSIPELGLREAIARGTQLCLQPGAKLSTRICASLFTAHGEPKGVDWDGRVRY